MEAALLRMWKPQLVYVSSVEALHMVGKLRLGSVPVALYVHELGSALASFEQTHPGLIASLPVRYAAISDAVGRDLVDVMGVPKGLVGVVRPFVLSPVPEPSQDLGSADRTPLVVGGAGKPSWTKGNDLWLLAARDVMDRLGADRVRFVWVGYRDNDDGLHFRSMISKLGLEGVVELIPETDRPHDHFARFDVFAMASWEESASLVVLEAMAMSIPVICFAPTGGPAEEVGDAGVVIPGISPRGMADAIVDLARSPQKRLAMGSAGAERVRAEFRREASVAALQAVFDAAVTTRRRA
jgi:glycosyltransferase involved in cell wall biosynthesis